MNKRNTSYVMLGVLAITVLLLNTIPTLADSNGMLRIESSPNGADAYVKYGPDAGKYLGITPFLYNPTLNGGVTYITLKKPGYRDSTGVVFKYMAKLDFTKIYLNPI